MRFLTFNNCKPTASGALRHSPNFRLAGPVAIQDTCYLPLVRCAQHNWQCKLIGSANPVQQLASSVVSTGHLTVRKMRLFGTCSRHSFGVAELHFVYYSRTRSAWKVKCSVQSMDSRTILIQQLRTIKESLNRLLIETGEGQARRHLEIAIAAVKSSLQALGACP